MPLWFILFFPAVMLTLVAGLAWASDLGDAAIESTHTPRLTATPTASPTATASSTPSPTPTPTPKLDRHSCDQIRDTQ